MVETYYSKHRDELLAYQNQYRKVHPDKPELARKHNASRYLRIKKEVLTHYGGGKCVCVACGFDDMRALSIDHINGGGNQLRKVSKMTSSYYFYGWLKGTDYPEGYQTLCMNCQTIKRKVNNELGRRFML